MTTARNDYLHLTGATEANLKWSGLTCAKRRGPNAR